MVYSAALYTFYITFTTSRIEIIIRGRKADVRTSIYLQFVKVKQSYLGVPFDPLKRVFGPLALAKTAI